MSGGGLAPGPVGRHDDAGAKGSGIQQEGLKPIGLQSLGHGDQIHALKLRGRLSVEPMAGDALKALAAHQLTTAFAQSLAFFVVGRLDKGLGRQCGGGAIVLMQALRELGGALLTIGGHTGDHVGANPFAIVDAALQPLQAQLGADPIQRWRDPRLGPQIRFGGGEAIFQSCGHTSQAVACMAGQALKPGQIGMNRH